MKTISVSFRHIQQIETICTSFEVLCEFEVGAKVMGDDVEIVYIYARCYSVHQNPSKFIEILLPSGNLSQDQKKMMATFREMARNEAYKQSKQNAKDVH